MSANALGTCPTRRKRPLVACPAFGRVGRRGSGRVDDSGSADAAQDAELFARINAERDLAPKVDEADQASEEALARTEWPAAPDALIYRDNDSLGRPKMGDHFGEADREITEALLTTFRAVSRKDLASKDAPRLIDGELRAEEILDALNQDRTAR